MYGTILCQLLSHSEGHFKKGFKVSLFFFFYDVEKDAFASCVCFVVFAVVLCECARLWSRGIVSAGVHMCL